MGAPGLEPGMPKPQIYSLLRFQFRSHTHKYKILEKSPENFLSFQNARPDTSHSLVIKKVIINADEYDVFNIL